VFWAALGRLQTGPAQSGFDAAQTQISQRKVPHVVGTPGAFQFWLVPPNLVRAERELAEAKTERVDGRNDWMHWDAWGWRGGVKVLQLPQDASQKQIRTQYRRLALQWHPDKNPPEQRERVQAKFIAITSAFQLISMDHKP